MILVDEKEEEQQGLFLVVVEEEYEHHKCRQFQIEVFDTDGNRGVLMIESTSFA
jgi:hypothetical protein